MRSYIWSLLLVAIGFIAYLMLKKKDEKGVPPSNLFNSQDAIATEPAVLIAPSQSVVSLPTLDDGDGINALPITSDGFIAEPDVDPSLLQFEQLQFDENGFPFIDEAFVAQLEQLNFPTLPSVPEDVIFDPFAQLPLSFDPVTGQLKAGA
jgi:hypothetical protein